MTRTLKTLIEQFNRASEIDAFSKAVIGKTYWVEVDGIRTRLTDIWAKELSLEERATLEAYLVQVSGDIAQALGYETVQDLYREAGQKLFEKLTLGITT